MNQRTLGCALLVYTVFIALRIRAQQFIYCGQDNCYHVLGVDEQASQREISKAYRQLARTLHPDRNKASNANEQFHRIVTAYEVLKDEDTRHEYDYFLKHPDEYYRNIFRYYKRRAAPKVDVLPVVVTVITLISLFQYLNKWRYHNTIKSVAIQDENLRAKAKRVVVADGRWSDALTKEAKHNLLDTAVLEIVQLRGDYGPPTLSDTLAVSLIMLPISIYRYFSWLASWYYRITFMKQDLTEEDKHYLIRKNLDLSSGKYEHTIEATPGFLKEVWAWKCWDKGSAQKYIGHKQKEQQRQLMKSNKYKRYRRWLKANPEEL